MAKDFIPRNWSAFADWTDNFNSQLQILAAKYGISAGKLTQTQKDSDWVKYWVQAKFNAKAQDKQLTDYADTIANGNLGTPQPNEPTWALPRRSAGRRRARNQTAFPRNRRRDQGAKINLYAGGRRTFGNCRARRRQSVARNDRAGCETKTRCRISRSKPNFANTISMPCASNFDTKAETGS